MATDVSSIEPIPFAFRPGTLYQFIGEVDYRDMPAGSETERCVVMKALACRCMDGLDMDVYMRAHQTRMKELQTPMIPPMTLEDTSESMTYQSPAH